VCSPVGQGKSRFPNCSTHGYSFWAIRVLHSMVLVGGIGLEPTTSRMSTVWTRSVVVGHTSMHFGAAMCTPILPNCVVPGCFWKVYISCVLVSVFLFRMFLNKILRKGSGSTAFLVAHRLRKACQLSKDIYQMELSDIVLTWHRLEGRARGTAANAATCGRCAAQR
jgi:hypothetical protein